MIVIGRLPHGLDIGPAPARMAPGADLESDGSGRATAMRLGNLIAATPIVAVGLASWRHARWLAVPENALGRDGTCAGIEELSCDALALASFLGP